jgi:carbon storage regulator
LLLAEANAWPKNSKHETECNAVARMQLFFTEDTRMLVLGRKQNEAIRIGDRIKITIREVSGNKVKLAIDAPKWIKVDREEIWIAKTPESLRLLVESEGASK